jgi:AraC-like DNA-binding protein
MVLIQGVMLDLILQSLDLLDTHVVSCQNFASLHKLFKRATRISAEGKIADPDDAAWELSSLAYEILLSVARNKVEEKVPPQIRQSMTFMLHNLDKPLSLEQIAAKSGMSMFHFSRRFREAAGSPPLTYFMHQKMRLAQNLLKNSNMLVKEIATVLGYNDPLYFSAQFKKFRGISPREYRLQKSG